MSPGNIATELVELFGDFMGNAVNNIAFSISLWYVRSAVRDGPTANDNCLANFLCI